MISFHIKLRGYWGKKAVLIHDNFITKFAQDVNGHFFTLQTRQVGYGKYSLSDSQSSMLERGRISLLGRKGISNKN